MEKKVRNCFYLFLFILFFLLAEVDEKSLHDKKADTGEDEEVSNKNEEDEKKKRKVV